MSNYGVTGWSGGVRQSLTYNLKAGQMRGMGRVNVFPSTTIVNNNFGGGYGFYNDSCYCNNTNTNSTPSWMNWMMGIGLGTSLLGNILGMFGIGGGGGKTEGAGEAKTEAPKQDTTENKKLDEFEGLKVLYPDGKFAKVGDKYCCRIGDKVIEADSLVDLNKALKEALEGSQKPEVKKDEVEPKQEPKEEKLESGSITSAIDEALGNKSTISGTVSNNADGTVSIEGKTNTYTYEKGTKQITYNNKQYTVYSLKGAINNKTGHAVQTTEQEYILINGQLVQPKDCTELAGLGTGSTPPPTRH